MAEIVNLNRARKAKARCERAAAASVNRARHGRTAAEKAADRRDGALRDALLDGARRDAGPGLEGRGVLSPSSPSSREPPPSPRRSDG